MRVYVEGIVFYRNFIASLNFKHSLLKLYKENSNITYYLLIEC